MKTNDNIPADARDEVIELGVASVETQGGVIATEGFGGLPMPGISED
ncbi:benenodin family lasso peptide [Luteimonas fraxinea]|uniref:Benenodin family lasso peptide n=1 Tax=Luteimonas fraxinea TaxID=2901869 RepID=A0ABS8U9W6_9GAMM|nr:benenodin family lasso peptide [Luteimonas fraxinea]MCD9095365.1 benenodin family lasso peptide [Luteimonas fraxinea]UHH11421.1 benenodin family lasso peptide [Luteimonas fraxinea]